MPEKIVASVKKKNKLYYALLYLIQAINSIFKKIGTQVFFKIIPRIQKTFPGKGPMEVFLL